MELKKVIKINNAFVVGLYSCDKDGNVFSHHKKNKKKLKPRVRPDGYTQFQFYTEDRVFEVYGHQAVKIFFGQDILEKFVDLEINHKNGNKSDNRLINLELITADQNRKHSLINKLNPGFKRKLTCGDVREIKLLANSPISISKLSIHYKVTRKTIRQILQGKTWKNI